VMGTPSYMSPEQAGGDIRHVDQRSDVYSLGATLYDLLAGVPPFTDDSTANILIKVLTQDPPPLRSKAPAVPEALEIIVDRCLRKEPHRRYQTALELAADLGRFLERRRLVARRQGLASKLYWKGRRNKPMAAVVIALFLSVVGFVGYGVRTAIEGARREAIARKRAEIAQKLGTAVKDLEWLVRSAHLVPLHDTGPEKAVVRARMADIESEMRSYGDLAAGFDHYALGRGHLALQEWDKAHEHLARAEAEGVRSPELDYALGRVLGELYRRALEDARRSGDKSYFARRKAELEQEYLAPALVHLEKCRGLPTVSASYLDGLIDFYHQRHDAALASARSARKGTPWLYEAARLEGDVFMARALDAKDRGENEQAEAAFREAVARYEEAADIGRSDHEVYEALAEAWIRQEELDMYRGRDPGAKLAKALAAADKAIAAAPAESHGHTKRAFAYLFPAQYAQRHGAAPEVVERLFRMQIAAGGQAIVVHPNDAYAHEITGAAEFLLAAYLEDRGAPVQELLDDAVVRLEAAVRANPKFPWAYNDYGLALGYSASSRRRRNQDPRALFEKAIATTRMATQIDDQYVNAYSNTAGWLNELAEWQTDHGENPEESVREAVRMADRAIQINKKHPIAYTNSGSALTRIAAYRLDTGEDGREPARQALERFEARLALDPRMLLALTETARTWQLLAAHEHALGLDPRASLDAGDRAVEACRRVDPASADCKAVDAQLRSARGQWARRNGEPADALFAQAQRLAREATDKVAGRGDLWLVLAQVSLDRAEALPAAGRRPGLDEGLAAVARALKLTPGFPRALAVEGALLLRKAEGERDAAARKVAEERARASLAQAFAGNPLLERRYGGARPGP
ncbi:MAG TPA: hypothetical protein VK420_20355, partial [Longimicrobium sp.]|nr:hypothetical protein [Longimicrobium sp.]